jgi:glycosyltransferase involved in cell wall biosynthesis
MDVTSGFKKILYITYDGLTDPLGQSQVIPYVEGLADKGYDITIMSYEKPDRYKLFGKQITERLELRKILWKPFRYHKRFSLFATLYDLLIGFFYLLFAIPGKKIKIIHCRSYIASILGLVFKKLYSTKFIFDMRGFWADERVEGNVFKKGAIYNFFKWLEKQFLLNADATISLTRNAVHEIATWKYMTPNKAMKLHHITTCCNIDEFSQSFAYNIRENKVEQPITFLYVGSIGPWHSPEKIKSFIHFVYNYLPYSKFKMIINWGASEMVEYIRERSYDLSRFTIESLTHDQIPEAIKGADIGFFFIPPTYWKKGCSPTKMGEMLAAGIPTITGHSIGDVDELVASSDIGFVLKEFSDIEYKVAVDHVLSLIRQDKQQLLYRCREVAEDYFSLEKGVERYAGIYQSLLQKN